MQQPSNNRQPENLFNIEPILQKEYKMRTPKFKIGDIVHLEEDNHHFNPCEKVSSIGQVLAIHIYRGHAISFRSSKGETKPASLKGIITYSISGFSFRPKEEQLKFYAENSTT